MWKKIKTWWLMRPRQVSARLDKALVWGKFYSPTFQKLMLGDMPIYDRLEMVMRQPIMWTIDGDYSSAALSLKKGQLWTRPKEEDTPIITGFLMHRYNYQVGSFLKVAERDGTISLILLLKTIPKRPERKELISFTGLQLGRGDLNILKSTDEWVHLKKEIKDLPLCHMAREKDLKEILKKL